jgi:adenine phosphoribosyltransferase
MDLRKIIREVPDFPKEGILFYDITPVLRDPLAFRQVVDTLVERYRGQTLTHVVGVESRGFIFAGALAYALGIGLVIIRKPGKLPADTYSASYALEYGEDSVEIHKDALQSSDRVVLIDDLLATGGTARAAVELIENCGAKVHEIAFVIELAALRGRQKLAPHAVHNLLTY